MPKERTVSMVQLDADQRPPWDFRNSPASEWALTVNSIVRGVLDASVGESLHVLKKNACREHPEFEFIAELVTQAVVEAWSCQRRSGNRRGKMKEVAVQTSRKADEQKMPHDLTETFGRRWFHLNARRDPERNCQCTYNSWTKPHTLNCSSTVH